MILYLFLSHLGLGIVFTLVCVSREAGVKFFRFNAGLAAILLAAACAFRSADEGTAARLGFQALVIAEAAIVLYWLTVGRGLARMRPATLTRTAAASSASADFPPYAVTRSAANALRRKSFGKAMPRSRNFASFALRSPIR